MSQEHARACVERMKTDETFRAKVLGGVDAASRMQVVGAEGFACSAEEIEAAGAELSDADLETVAGGFANFGDGVAPFIRSRAVIIVDTGIIFRKTPGAL